MKEIDLYLLDNKLNLHNHGPIEYDQVIDKVDECYNCSMKTYEWGEEGLSKTYLCLVDRILDSDIEVYYNGGGDNTVIFRSKVIKESYFFGLFKTTLEYELKTNTRDEVLSIIDIFFTETDEKLYEYLKKNYTRINP